MRVHRIDLGTLAAPVRRSDGTLVADARLARTGCQSYRSADGSTRVEYRPDAEVSKSMDGMKLVPLTNLHPPTMGDASTWKSIAVGAVGENVRRDGMWIVAPIAVHDGATIKQMDAGELRQVSVGYDCELDETPGTAPDGTRYDAVQREILPNHVALVPNARAGKDAAVRMDAAFSEEDGSDPGHGNRQHRSDVMNLEQALAALAKAQQDLGATTARADASAKERDALQKRFDALTAERDDLKEKHTKADKARTDAEGAMPGRIKARVQLETKAREILGATDERLDGDDAGEGDDLEQKFDDMTDRVIKLAVIKHVTDADCDVDTAGAKRSDEYVNARYDAACERASNSADTFRAANDIIAGNRLHTDALGSEQAKTDKARADMLEANRNGWRAPGTVATTQTK